MCIIIAKPIGVNLPTDETLDYCAKINKDGLGIAWTIDNMVRIKKDFVDVDELKAFIKAYIRVEDGALIHFRIGTRGANDEGNRHPFPITKRSKRLRALETITDMAVAHNGTFSTMDSHKKYSDTLLFIKNILSDPIVRNNLGNEAIQELLNGYLDTSKLAIMDRRGTILRFGTFYTNEGLLYSNYNYKPYTSSNVGEEYHEGYGEWFNYRRQCYSCYDLKDIALMQELRHGVYKCKECIEKCRLITHRVGDDNA